MKDIEFLVHPVPRDVDDPRGRPYLVVDAILGGIPFLALVRNVETSFAAAEGHADLAGKYEGLPASVVLPPSRHFLGEPDEQLYVYDDKVALYECECGCPGCWPLLARIVVSKRRVSWLDFEQPHRRRGNLASWWQYDALGPFIFDRDEYESSLAQAAAELTRIA